MTTIGVIVGNRGFFPDHLCVSGRNSILKALKNARMKPIILPVKATKFGAIETLADARICADHLKEHRYEIDGILVTLPNFGDERAVANALRMAGLDVPVLVHAFSDDPARMTVKDRRDSFCGKISVCNNLRQYGIKYSLTRQHTTAPESEAFGEDLRRFAAVCSIVKGLKNVRFGAIGARPAAFNTVRYSEKLLEAAGISVETLDLSELFDRANKLGDRDPKVKKKAAAVKRYTDTKSVPAESLLRMAKLGVAIDDWMAENDLSATALQCWTALEEIYGIVPCALMSMMSNNLHPSACETDIGGLVGMYALQCASGTPSALLDWNNNYGDDPNKGVVFHCSNLPKHMFDKHQMDYQEIIAGSVGKDNAYGAVVGRIRCEPFTYCRVSTDDVEGRITSYLGEGHFTDDRLTTFGGYGVVEIPDFNKLLAHICENGFEHHVAANLSLVGDPLEEAFSKYLGWKVYRHKEENCPVRKKRRGKRHKKS